MNNATSKKEFLSQNKKRFYEEIKAYQQTLKPTKEIIGFGSAPIVGEKNYPFLATHNISNIDKKTSFFETGKLVKKTYDEILPLKAKSILGTTQKNYIKKPKARIVEELRDIYKSKTAIEMQSSFEKELRFTKIVSSKVAGVMGSQNELTKLEAQENTKTSNKIEKYTENDIKAKEAIISLYEKGVNEHQIINLLALGSFGIELNRKLVPTKWAISAFDQTIDNYLHKKILKYNLLNQFEVYQDYDKGNDFIIILMPNTYSAEIVETWDLGESAEQQEQKSTDKSHLFGVVTQDKKVKIDKWNTGKRIIIEQDYVSINNKLKTKDPQCAGGYWATKSPINRFLDKRQKQASYLSIRFIDNYDIPLGVVFVRECARKALTNCIFKSSSQKEVEEFIKQNYPRHHFHFTNSATLKEEKKQTRLTSFFNA
jgi:hypothetical protein